MMKRMVLCIGVLICVLACAFTAALAADEFDASETAVVFAPGDTPGTLSATLSGVPDNVSSALCTVWCEMADAKEYPAVRQEDGTWKVCVTSAEHGWHTGEYTLEACAVRPDGIRANIGTATAQLTYAGPLLTAEPADEHASRISLRLEHAQLPPGSPVWFRVSPVQNPKACVACFGYRQPDGSYVGTLTPDRLAFAGTYSIEAVTDGSVLGQTLVEIEGCTSAALTAEMTDCTAGLFEIQAAADSASGVRSMSAAVWSAPDQSDLVWYEMHKSADTWTVSGSVRAHEHHFGTYNVHTYAVLGNGLRVMTAGTTCEFAPCRYVYADCLPSGQCVVTMLGTGLAPGTVLQLPTWSAEKGQDDLYWYSAAVEGDGSLRCPIDLSLHSASSPTFLTHVYQGGACIGGLEYTADGVRLLSPVELHLNQCCRTVYEEAGYDLHSVYLWTVDSIKYTPRPWQKYIPDGYTREQWYAQEGFDTHKGDCFVYAATFAALARGLGFDAEYVEGYVWSVRGVWADHGFVVIHQADGDYVCDPELQSVSSKPKDLFMQPPGRTAAKYKW